MSFALSRAVNQSKVFLTRKSEVSARWDPFYFRPELVELENRVRKVTHHRLRDFVVRMAGGATPSTTEADTHYTESADGVPFIRVQNLSTTARLNLDDCKRITRNTHEGLLGRSKLSGGELLVKITGVGRMAVASVVPDGFEGNINQHIVAIRTKDTKTSETLAAYLNLDIAERLASRRSTGGTRPALDYPALLSVPIIYDERVPKLVNKAIQRFETRLKQAEQLLKNVYEGVQTDLGIKNDGDSVEAKGGNDSSTPTMFMARRSEITDRIDPEMVLFRRKTHKFKFPVCTIRSLLREPPQYGAGERGLDRVFLEQPRYVRITDIDEWAFLSDELGATAENVEGRYILEENDLLLARSGTVGKAYLHKKAQTPYPCFYAGYLIRFRFNNNAVLPSYVFAFTQLPVFRRWVKAVQRTAVQSNINAQEYSSLVIPLPPRLIQAKIAAVVEKGRINALELRCSAARELLEEKREIQALILSKESGA